MRWLVGLGLILIALGVVRLVGCGEETPLQCVEDEDCDDQNDCTDDSCVERWSCCLEGKYYGRCENRAVEYGRCDFDGLDDVRGGLDGICVAGLCEKNPCDDGNECTVDYSVDGSCEHHGCSGCQPCDRNGEPGVCDGDVCAEYPCNDGVLCDDGDICTVDSCNPHPWNANYGMCEFSPRCRSNPCRVASCDPADGSCHYSPVNDGGSCSAYCLLGRPVCSGGECICLVGNVGAVEVQP